MSGAPHARPRFGVAFGGGGARGLAHIHVIDALDDLGIRPAAIAGTSIGALIGGGMAAGMSGQAIHDHVRAILGTWAGVAGRMWQARPGTAAEAFANGFRIGQFNLERILAAFLPAAIPGTFEQLAIPFQAAATDFYGNAVAVLAEGDLRSALAASAAIPALFRPVRRDGKILIDGGIANPVPFDLLEKQADIVIAVDVVGAPSGQAQDRISSMELMLGASQLMMQAITAAKLRQMCPDILLRPPVSQFRVLDFMKVEAVLRETVGVRDETKRAVEAAVSRWESRQTATA